MLRGTASVDLVARRSGGGGPRDRDGTQHRRGVRGDELVPPDCTQRHY